MRAPTGIAGAAAKSLAATLLLLPFAVPPPAGAATTFMVTKTADTADGTCSAADCSLREAIIAANATAGADVIRIPAGTFTMQITGQDENAAATGDYDLTDDVTIRGAGSGKTTINAATLDRVFDVSDATVTVSDLTITGGDADTASNFLGGGVYADLTSDVTLGGTVVTGNEANAGGGIATNGTVTVTDSTVTTNTASNMGFTNAYGGNVWSNGGTLSISRSLITHGTAASVGAGIWSESGGSITVEDSTVGGNDGVGVRIQNVNGTITGATIADNNAEGVNVFSCCGHTVTVSRTIIAGNAAVQCSGTAGVLVSGDHNVVGDATCGFSQPNDQQNTDPLLGPLANNGGPTKTYAIGPASPALDLAPAGPSCTGTDQRGVPRPGGSGPCDAGAYEYETCHGLVVDRVGTNGKDVVAGTSANDGILAFGGNDTVRSKGGNDRICGGAGKDVLKGGGGRDLLDGETGSDTCSGGPGRDKQKACERTTSVP